MLNKNQLHPYQRRAVDHIIDNENCGLFLDMGLGKTVSSLTAIQFLLNTFNVSKVLVIAPKKVTQVTWTDERDKWSHLKDLRISVIDGTAKQRLEAIHRDADIYAVSRDNIVWLIDQFGGVKLPYDMLVIDELSSFKSPSSKRFKALRRARRSFHRVVGLTGTPAPNGLIDLWSQMFLIDEGERLGKTITSYRNEYFTPGRRNGDIIYQYDLRKPAEETERRISDKIGDICLSMTAEDYLKMPEKVMLYDTVKMSPKVQKMYEDFEREQVLNLMGSDQITAASAAALSNKLCQFANGAVYSSDLITGQGKKVEHIHDEKIDKLAEIVEAANGHPVLIAYAYQHDRDRMLGALKAYKPEVLTDTKQIKRWNDGDVPVLITHPASAGHGLNLQHGGNIIVWFGNTWSLELYMQFNARLYRQGQDKPVYIHHLVTEGTIDERIVRSLGNKKDTQDGLMSAIKDLMLKYGS